MDNKKFTIFFLILFLMPVVYSQLANQDFNGLSECLLMPYAVNTGDWNLTNFNTKNLDCVIRTATTCGASPVGHENQIYAIGLYNQDWLTLRSWDFTNPGGDGRIYISHNYQPQVIWNLTGSQKANLSNDEIIISFKLRPLYLNEFSGAEALRVLPLGGTGTKTLALSSSIIARDVDTDTLIGIGAHYNSPYADATHSYWGLLNYNVNGKTYYSASEVGGGSTLNNGTLLNNTWYDMAFRYYFENVGAGNRRVYAYRAYQNGEQIFNYTIPASDRYGAGYSPSWNIQYLYLTTYNSIYDIDDLQIWTNYTNYELNISSNISNSSNTTYFTPDLPVVSDLCPIENCMFYEDFTTFPIRNVAGSNMTIWIPTNVMSYDRTQEIDGVLYWNNTPDMASADMLSIVWNPKPDDENVVTAFVQVDINDTQPYYYPIGNRTYLGTTLFYYIGFMYDWVASIEPVMDFVLEIKPYDATTYTIILNEYDVFSLKPKLSFNYKKSYGDLSFRFVYDYKADKLAITPFVANKQFADHAVMDLTDFAKLHEIDRIQLSRMDSLNMSWGHVGIDSVWAYYTTYSDFGWYPLTSSEEEEAEEEAEENFNEGQIFNDSLPPVDDTLQNLAGALGFGSTAARLLFWLIFMVIITIAVAIWVPGDTFVKTIVVFIMFFGLFVVGYFMDFIPPSVFVFVIMMCAAFVAFKVRGLFAGGG